MGDIILNPPSVPNNVTDSWQPLVDRDAMSYFGLNRIALTQWNSSTSLPVISGGSAIDIDGSIARFPIDEVIDNPLALSGVIYVKFVVTDQTVVPEFTSTAPVWEASKSGLYNTSGERYSGHYMTRSGASYTDKAKLADRPDEQLTIGSKGNEIIGDVEVKGGISVTGEVSGTKGRFSSALISKTQAMTNGSSFIIPLGTNHFSYEYYKLWFNTIIEIQTNVSGTWVVYERLGENQNCTVYSDGVSFRAVNILAGSGTLHWLLKE